MGKFILTVNSIGLAGQIANLINSGDQLKFTLTKDNILYNPTKYLIELHKDKVIGTIGIMQRSPKVTELKHLCVHPDYRCQGIGKELLEKGVQASETEFVFGRVRNNNFTNIRNNLRIGMIPIGKKNKRTYSMIVFARRKNSDTIYGKRY
jgi:ribosomal protein S18 acetylase RimI-like enzyme